MILTPDVKSIVVERDEGVQVRDEFGPIRDQGPHLLEGMEVSALSLFELFFDNVAMERIHSYTLAYAESYLHQCNFHVTMCTFAIICVQWLTEVFLPYLEEWETSVSERSGFTKIEKGMMLLSRETRLGLKITGWLQMITNITQILM